ncbi:dnaG [Symbiodinium microadriaticum]|nr:dnaG [Symbiodinium microadriaticum]
MSFPDDFLDEVRSRTTLSEIVGRRVTWDARKSNPRRRDFWACCPFHSEKSPSFHVEDDKGRYYCFGCHAKGDAITFLMEQEAMAFPEAVRHLAELAGLPVPEDRPRDPEREARAKGLADVMAAAQDFYRDMLRGEQGKDARRYLAKERGVTPELAGRFGIGFAPDSRHALKEHLAGKGFEPGLMVESGMLIQPDADDNRNSDPYDRFRNRIMFPITDRQDRVIAFGGRDMSGNSRAKYLNSPETPLFHKSRVLYNLKEGGAAARRAGTVLVTEGYMDVIALAQAGIDHAVAPLGTALTEDHLQMVWRLVADPTLCFDGDEAGRRAAYRAVDLALPFLKPGQSLRFALLPTGQDPDDIVKAGGRRAMDQIVEESKSLSDLLWLSATEGEDLSTPEARAGLEAELGRRINLIRDEKVRRHYQEDMERRTETAFGTRADFSEGPAPTDSRPARQQGQNGYRGRQPEDPWAPKGTREEWVRDKRGRRQKVLTGASNALKSSLLGKKSQNDRFGGPGNSALMERRERLILATIIQHPDLIEDHLEDLGELHFSAEMLDKCRSEIIEHASCEPDLVTGRLKRHLTDQGLDKAIAAIDADMARTQRGFLRADAEKQVVEKVFLNLLSRHRRLTDLEQDRQAAVDAFARDVSVENEQALKDIQEEIGRLINLETSLD